MDELLAANIAPFATLYHWDLPQALQDRGGWQSRDTAHAFAEDMGHQGKEVQVPGGTIKIAIAPGVKLTQRELNRVRHHAVLAHGLAVQAIRAHAKPHTQVGPAEVIEIAVPLIDTPEHVRAAEQATREGNAPFLTVMLEGKYTDAYLSSAGKDAPEFTDEDLKIISSPVDFVGINVYKPTVTENGCASQDVPAEDGKIYDTDRPPSQDSCRLPPGRSAWHGCKAALRGTPGILRRVFRSIRAGSGVMLVFSDNTCETVAAGRDRVGGTADGAADDGTNHYRRHDRHQPTSIDDFRDDGQQRPVIVARARHTNLHHHVRRRRPFPRAVVVHGQYHPLSVRPDAAPRADDSPTPARLRRCRRRKPRTQCPHHHPSSRVHPHHPPRTHSILHTQLNSVHPAQFHTPSSFLTARGAPPRSPLRMNVVALDTNVVLRLVHSAAIPGAFTIAMNSNLRPRP